MKTNLSTNNFPKFHFDSEVYLYIIVTYNNSRTHKDFIKFPLDKTTKCRKVKIQIRGKNKGRDDLCPNKI